MVQNKFGLSGHLLDWKDVFPCAVSVAAPSSPTHSNEADNQQGAEPMTGGGAVTGIQTDRQ